MKWINAFTLCFSWINYRWYEIHADCNCLHLNRSFEFFALILNILEQWIKQKNRNLMRWLSVKHNHVIEEKSRTRQLNRIIVLGNIQTVNLLMETSSMRHIHLNKLCFLMDMQDIEFRKKWQYDEFMRRCMQVIHQWESYTPNHKGNKCVFLYCSQVMF